MASPRSASLVPVEHIARSILVLRGQKVLLDAELAALYGVTTKRFNEQVRRNRKRFPADFTFQLSAEEAEALRSQIATSKSSGRGGRRYLPFAFTEHGAIMAATILNSPRAVEMSVYIVRAFVELRELLASNKDLARRLDELEARIEKKFATHDQAIAATLSAIRQLMNPPAPERRPIGFTADADLEGMPFDEFEVPSCTQCGGMLKPDVVFFGEGVPRPRVDTAMERLERADAVLVVGSSLMLYSGYRFVQAAAQSGKPIAAVNLGRTRADELLTLKVSQPCAHALAGL